MHAYRKVVIHSPTRRPTICIPPRRPRNLFSVSLFTISGKYWTTMQMMRPLQYCPDYSNLSSRFET